MLGDVGNHSLAPPVATWTGETIIESYCPINLLKSFFFDMVAGNRRALSPHFTGLLSFHVETCTGQPASQAPCKPATPHLCPSSLLLTCCPCRLVKCRISCIMSSAKKRWKVLTGLLILYELHNGLVLGLKWGEEKMAGPLRVWVAT